MPKLVVDDELLPNFVQDWRAFAIDGEMPYARSTDTVLCIVGNANTLNALFPVFLSWHTHLDYAYERRQLYTSRPKGMLLCWASLQKLDRQIRTT